MNTIIDIISDLRNFSYRSTSSGGGDGGGSSSSGGGGGVGGGGGGSGNREVIFAIVLKYLTYIHNFTISPVTLAAPLLTVFSAQFVVSFSIA